MVYAMRVRLRVIFIEYIETETHTLTRTVNNADVLNIFGCKKIQTHILRYGKAHPR